MAGTAQHLRAATDHLIGADGDRLKSDLAALRGDLERVLSVMTDAGSNVVTSARQQGSQMVGRLTAEAGSLADDLGERGRGHAAQVGRRIQAQPLLAIGVAFSAGLLLGALAARR